MSKIHNIITGNSITVVLNNRTRTMDKTNPNFEKAKAAIRKNNVAALEDAFDIRQKVVRATNKSKIVRGRVVIKDEELLYDGQPLHNVVVDRIFDLIKENLPFEPLVGFLEKIQQNPSKRSVDELYKFLEHKNLPLTEDGNVLGYKSVRKDYTDHHTGTISNKIGQVCSMPRNQVCDDPNKHCNMGLHIGSHNFANGFHPGNGSHLMIVKFNPADCVSVPNDANCQKLRVCKYTVIGECEDNEKSPLTESAVYKNDTTNGVKPFISIAKLPKRDSNGRFVKSRN